MRINPGDLPCSSANFLFSLLRFRFIRSLNSLDRVERIRLVEQYPGG